PALDREHAGFMPGAVSLAHREGGCGDLLAGRPALAQAHALPPAPPHTARSTRMSSTAEALSSPAQAAARYGALDRLLRQRLLATLGDLRGGQLVVRDALGTVALGEPGGQRARPRRAGVWAWAWCGEGIG